MWDHVGLERYIDWSFSNDYLLCVSGENSISGVAVAYPLPKPFNGELASLLPSDEQIFDENLCDLVVMDWMADNSESRRALVNQFKKRFLNWQNQRKLGIHYGKPKELSNKYINLLTLNN